MPLKTLKLEQWEEFFLPAAKPLSGAYTVKSAMKALKVNRQRVYQLIHSGGINAVQLVDSEGEPIEVLISKKSVHEYLEYRESNGTIPRPRYAVVQYL